MLTLLYTFGGKPFNKNRRCLPSDTDHKPGGLWLTEDRTDGWKNHVLRCITENPSEWCYGDLRYETVFEFSPDDHGRHVLTVASVEDMEDFLENYLEATERNCKSEDLECIRGLCIPGCPGSCYNCHGFHIAWDRVKADYSGFALTFHSEAISHRSRDPRLHWSRLDCASWCFWDGELSCLTTLEENVTTEYSCDGKCLSSHCPMQ